MNKNVSKNVYICAMIKQFEKYKGIHPGIVLDRELKKRSIKQRPFALSLEEHPQTFNAITKGKRGISTGLALKIEQQLGLEEGTLVILQAYYDIQKIKEKEIKSTPNLHILSKALFWDTDIQLIDWERQYRAVIQRVFERGNENDKNEIIRFYGTKKVNQALQDSNIRSPYTIYKLNKTKD
ncbi:plasmid maintenance system antidote protein [uncultured Chryseobacterium sp.]|jgi:Plasmid maintenance system antidote protein|uniref:helix-turn-helix transcriptional regulator n=1 Tax=uncultured Chryseobacterium sp. TaxID=259322 RepID=UPI002625AF2D|nr:plasmid maintenance system antidote protein [uncultured Chryseobacterium sp.]